MRTTQTTVIAAASTLLVAGLVHWTRAQAVYDKDAKAKFAIRQVTVLIEGMT